MARRKPQPVSHWFMVAVATLAVVIDQFSKWAVVQGMGLAEAIQIEVLPPYLVFRYGENRGINFGLFDSGNPAMPWILMGISLVLVLAVWIWVWRGQKGRGMQLAAGLLIGGALGNVIDRALYGYVLDFLNMSCCGIRNPYVFNLADVFIFAGAIGLALFDSDTGKKSPRRKTPTRKNPS